jgi:hypothetical protein
VFSKELNNRVQPWNQGRQNQLHMVNRNKFVKTEFRQENRTVLLLIQIEINPKAETKAQQPSRIIKK